MSARSVLACWDNSTRGLDASSALEFVQALRVTTNLIQDAAVVAIYQAGERVYEGTNFQILFSPQSSIKLPSSTKVDKSTSVELKPQSNISSIKVGNAWNVRQLPIFSLLSQVTLLAFDLNYRPHRSTPSSRV